MSTFTALWNRNRKILFTENGWMQFLEELVEYYGGFEDLGKQINIKCFTDNPSINSSLKFLRKTDWARTKVESLYLYVLRQKKKNAKTDQ